MNEYKHDIFVTNVGYIIQMEHTVLVMKGWGSY